MAERVTWCTDNLLVLDEAGAHLGMASRYGRAPKGERVKSPVPLNKGTRFSMIGAITTQRVEAALYGEWSTDSVIFETFIEQQVVPKLKPGMMVIWDNVAFHRNARVRQLIEGAGACIKPLPGYSPDLSPIEKLWAKLKHYLRKSAPRSIEEFHVAIKAAFQTITATDLRAWFTCCGYPA